MKRLLPLLLMASPAYADRIVVPPTVERAGTVIAEFTPDPPVATQAAVTIEWTDSTGRLVARHRAELAPGAVARFPLDLSRAVVMHNTLRATIARPARSETTATFIARPPAGAWNEFQIISYPDHAPARHAGLRAIGITAMKVFGHRAPFTTADVAPRIAANVQGDFHWYVENIATDFYSPYHMWSQEHPNQVHWRFLEAQSRHQRDPADLTVYERSPSLSDPAWLTRIADRLSDHVRAHAPYRPLYFSLGDEPGIADLAAAWDFDRSPPALAAFRAWLRLRYGSLAALNAIWASDHAEWNAILPETTTAAMARADGNYAAWNDHKIFMDDSFAAALKTGTAAIHAADPAAFSGIEGGQIPGWGGWDYGRLAHTVDVMEIYETGQNLDIALSQNPDLITISTTFTRDTAERRRIWRAALRGLRGLIIWDDDDAMVRDDGTAGPGGRPMAPLFTELRDGIGALLIASRPQPDAIAVLYSPASFRLQWLLDHRAQGDAWTQRSSEREGDDNIVRAAMRDVANRLATLGATPLWITPEQLAAGILRRQPIETLILPRSLALSDAEIVEINAFAATGGNVLPEGEFGTHDGHLRPRAAPPLSIPTRPATPLPHALILPTSRTRTGPPTVTTRRNGAVTLFGIQSARKGFSAALDQHRITLPHEGYVRHLRGPDEWHLARAVTISLDGEGPALFALSPTPLPAITLAPPANPRAGETARLTLKLAATSPAETTILHVETRDPAGHIVPAYTGNAALRGTAREWPIPFALNDPPGDWTVTVHDIMGGSTATIVVRLAAP